MQNDKPTPRTDAITAGCHFGPLSHQLARHAGQLERELAEAQEAIKDLMTFLSEDYQCEDITPWYRNSINRAKKAAGMEGE